MSKRPIGGPDPSVGKGMHTTYGTAEEQEMIAPEPVKPEGLAELEAEALAEARKEYERLQREEAEARERDKQERIERLRIANVKRSLESKLRIKEEIQQRFIDQFVAMLEVAEEDLKLLNEAGALLADLEASGSYDNVNVDFMLDGGSMPHDLERYMDRQLGRIITKWKHGAEFTPESMIQP